MNICSGADRLEVADIFRLYGPTYRKARKLPRRHRKAMRALECCRTSALGGHLDQCDTCGHQRPSYNSCRNRHCPKCQALPKERWLLARQRDLLPVGYFHMVFTIPGLLNPLTLVNQRVVYEILFRAAAQALLQLAKDAKYLGAEIGMIAILHTWGQNLMEHPHLHCVVPGGGLSKDGKQWICSRKNFMVPIKVLSRLFRGKFLFHLKRAYRAGDLKCVGKVAFLGAAREFQKLIDQLYRQDWVVYAKAPFGGPQHVLAYLGRYTHRVAISNNRLVKLENDRVTFRWRNYGDGGTNKLMTLTAFEFIRRFLLHILPDHFCKIRYYGILSSRHRKTKLKRCKELLGVTNTQEQPAPETPSWQDLLFELTGTDPRICPRCQKGRMVTREILQPALGELVPLKGSPP
jgi:hypothetical protein